MEFHIYAVHHDDGDYTDPDAAIDTYFYYRQDENGNWRDYHAGREYVVDKVKRGEVEAWTWPHDRRGAKCKVEHSYVHDIDYLKTIPNGDPEDNLSNLPEKSV